MKQVSIGDIAKFTNGFPFKTTDWSNSGFPIIRIQNLTDKSKPYNRTDKSVPEKYIVRKGDTLISWSATIDIFNWESEETAYLNQHIFRVDFDHDQINEQYFKHILKYTIADLTKFAHGATIKHVVKADFENHKIPLPDLTTQRKIAQLLSQAESIIVARKRTLISLNELLKSAFYDFFGDPVRNEKGWKRRQLGEIITDIVAGHSYSGKERPLNENELGVLKISAVTSGTFKPTEFKAISKTIIKKPVIFPKKGDLLFSRANTRELVGATCIVDKDYYNLFLPDKLWRVDINKSECNSYYLKYLLSNENLRSKLTETATGTSGSMLNISMKKFKDFDAPIAPLALQTQFAAVVDRVNKLRVQQQTSLTSLKLLYQSLLQAAFQGELDVSKLNEVVPRPTSTNSQDTSEVLTWKKLRSQVNDQSITLEDLQNLFPNADYPQIRELVFNAIDSAYLTQTYDTKERIVKLKAGAPHI